jgi:hypothetical protein
MQTPIFELYNNIYSTDVFIRAYQEHREMIESTKIGENQEEYNMVMRITCDYGNSLTSMNFHSQSLPILNKAKILLENYSGFNKSEMSKVEMYRTVLFNRGVSNYNLKRYSAARKDFHWLAQNNPGEIKFKNWIAVIGFRRYDTLIKALFFVIIFTGLFCIVTTEKRKNHEFLR